jgi:ribosomal protein L3 glutamine methyltransferase
MPDSELLTIRDHLRHAVSRFRQAGLVHGHGATTALDEAAFIILEALHLPVGDINPWLDARLLADERRRIVELVNERIRTRKPASYLLKKSYIRGIPFYVDERVIIPRSYLAELMLSEEMAPEDFAPLQDPMGVSRVLDLCTGSGCLAVIAAGVYPNAEIHAVDLSADALEVARINVEASGLQDRITLFHGDLFAPLKGERYDLIITNPPYVAAEEMALLPPEYRHEPRMALAGGDDGLDIVRRILEDAPHYLADGGGLLAEIGAGREAMELDYPDLDLLWLDTAESEGEVFWVTAKALKTQTS